MRRLFFKTLIIFSFIVFVFLIGCNGDLSDTMRGVDPGGESILAKVGEKVIIRQELEAALTKVPKKKHAVLKNRVLDDLIEARVFSEEAKKAGIDKDPDVREALDKTKNEILAKYYVKKYLDKEAEPSEETLKAFYLEHQDQFVVPESVLIQHIVVKDEAKAHELIKTLNAGESFETLAGKNSICRCNEKEGHHGWIYKGKMEPELEKFAFDLEKGVLSHIIKTKEGYQVIKVLDRRAQWDIPFEEAKSRIHSRLFWEKKGKLIDRYYQEAKVNTHPTEEGVLVKIGDEELTEDALAPILARTPEKEKEKVKLRWIEYFIETRVFSKAARNVHLEKDPDVAIELRIKTERILGNAFREQFINDKFPVTGKDIEEYYRSHQEEFRLPEKVRAKSILVNTREEAEEILNEVNEGTPFGYLATEKSLHPQASRRAGEIGWFGKGEKDPALEKIAFSLEKDDISDIIKTEAGYEIIKLMDKKGGEIRPLDEVSQTIKMRLMMQIYEKEKQRYYKKAGVKVFGP